VLPFAWSCSASFPFAIDTPQFGRDPCQVGVAKNAGVAGPTGGLNVPRPDHVLDPMQFLAEPAGDFPDGQQRFRLGHGRVPFPWAGCRIFRIRRDEYDARFAWCMGKRIYLGKDSQIGRLFWLLASPVGRARTLAEVQRAVDGFETGRDLESDNDGFKQASQRVRKALSKLRQALRDAEVDAHLLIVRGGSAASPEYTMVLRFGG
jgi:hypothetical protein